MLLAITDPELLVALNMLLTPYVLYGAFTQAPFKRYCTDLCLLEYEVAY